MKVKVTKKQKDELEMAFETYFEEMPVKFQGLYIVGSEKDLKDLAHNITMDYGDEYGLDSASPALKRSMMGLVKKILKEDKDMDLTEKYLTEDTKAEIEGLKRELRKLRKGRLTTLGQKRVEKIIADLVRLGDFSEI